MNRLKAILAAIAALAATVAGLDLTGIVSVLPPDVARALVVIPSAAAVSSKRNSSPAAFPMYQSPSMRLSLRITRRHTDSASTR